MGIPSVTFTRCVLRLISAVLKRAFIGVLLGLAGCRPADEQASFLPPTSPAVFRVPVLTQAAAGHLPVSAREPVKTIVPAWPPFAGRFPFAARLTLEKPESLGERDFIQGNYLRRLQAAQPVSSDGLEVVADYSCTVMHTEQHDSVAHPMFPVYVANATPQIKYVYGASSRLYAIQEARDRRGRWRPIERVGSEWCGGNEFALELPSRHLVVFLAKKYEGTFATELRMRMQLGECLYVSQPYAGHIEEAQFASSPADCRILEKYPEAVRRFYLGAVPMAMDSLKGRLKGRQAKR